MSEHIQNNKNEFIYTRSPYYGQAEPEKLVFNANLQEFAQKVSYISALETSGKLTTYEAYKQIRTLWKELKICKKEILSKTKEPPY